MKDEIVYNGFRNNPIGNDPADERIVLLSNELHINGNILLSWLTHTGDDTVTPMENNILYYYLELVGNKVPTEII